MRELIGIDPEGRSTGEKIEILLDYRWDQFWRLTDEVYKRRGWTKDGIPKLEKLIEIEMDLPQLVRIVRPYLKEEGLWPVGGEYAKYEQM
jgi:aldehyde:ferredoxin oxidoreductase